MSTPAWIADLFRAIDDRDAERFAAFLTDDATFQLATAAPAVGREAIRGAVARFFGSIRALRNDLSEAWDHPAGILVLGKTRTRVSTGAVSPLRIGTPSGNRNEAR
jgi:ketosteroid isomerase-like protein